MRKGLICLVGTALLAPFSISAQAAPKIVLKAANARLEEEFTLILSVRELSDGRVLIADARDNKVVVADFKTGAVTQVGRNGSGPGEYQAVGYLYPLGGDSSLMIDQRAARWNIFDGAKLAAALPPDAQIVIAIGRSISGADARGNVTRTMSTLPGAPIGGGRGRAPIGDLPDSGWVLRGNRTTVHVDTLARVKLRKTVMNTTTNAKGEIASISIVTPPLSVGEETALYPDGWLAIVRFEPYRVDWVSPDGKTTKGAALPWPVVKVDEREKLSYVTAHPNAARGAASAPDAIRKQLDEVSKLFPDVYPPIVAGGAIAMGDGRLLVHHPASADYPDARYDVVDRRGKLVGTIALGAGESLIAVARTAAYVSWKDSDDIERLRRHPWP